MTTPRKMTRGDITEGCGVFVGTILRWILVSAVATTTAYAVLKALGAW